MSRAYKFHNPEGLYFITFATVAWVDVFTRRDYKDIVVESLRFCHREKGLLLYAWVVMSNHVHLIAAVKDGHRLQDIMRDLKKFTSKQILKAIAEHPGEIRKEWMLRMFREAGEANSNNKDFQFWQHNCKLPRSSLERTIGLRRPWGAENKMVLLRTQDFTSKFALYGLYSNYIYARRHDAGLEAN